MARMKHRETGSTVNVPDEKVARLYGMGYDLIDDKTDAKKAPAKKAAAPSK